MDEDEHEEPNVTLAYVQYMKLLRRTKGLQAMRTLFRYARIDQRAGHQIYVANAKLHMSADNGAFICLSVLREGLKTYGDTPGYVDAYLDHLLHIPEHQNTRVLRFDAFVLLCRFL